MNVLLVALNAKYIHTCLAVHSLKAYADCHLHEDYGSLLLETAEYTINQAPPDVLRDILKKSPDLLALSCYIWNAEEVKKLATLFHMAAPSVPIWVGGPEVSYNAAPFLEENDCFAGVMTGEGEVCFTELLRAYAKGAQKESAGPQTSAKAASDHSLLADVPGIVYREESGRIRSNPAPDLLPLDELVFPYPDLKAYDHRILYYESSRGCPFGCSYCLSSIDRNVRFKSLDKVYEELQIFLDHKVPLVKFVDRTFNCDHRRTAAIWQFLKEHDNQITRFHFEIAADLLNEEELRLLAALRPGLLQLEIGVQTANPKTLEAIHRHQDMDDLHRITARIREAGNVHQHLDLIAGLPYEDMESFGRSFDAVYAMQPSQLQLGFLKVLTGSEMHLRREEFGIRCCPWPPYEVVSTRWISAEEMLRLKSIEEMVEIYYNSGQFAETLKYLLHFPSESAETSGPNRPWTFFADLADWMERNGKTGLSLSRQTRYELLRHYAGGLPGVEPRALDAILLYDMYLRENLKNRPEWAPLSAADKERAGDFFSNQNARENYLADFASDSVRQIRHETHLEFFPVNVLQTAQTGASVPEEWCVLFNYRNRNPLDSSAEARQIEGAFLPRG